MFFIKTLIDKHNFQVVKANKMAYSRWIATRLVNDFKDCPNLDIVGMKNILRKRYGVLVPVKK